MSSININRVVLTGNLTRDPELRSTPGGTSVCALRIASNTRRKTSDRRVGRQAQLLQRHRLGRAGRELRPLPHQGPPGRDRRPPRVARMDAQDGNKRESIEIVADAVQFLATRDDTRRPTSQRATAPTTASRPAGASGADAGRHPVLTGDRAGRRPRRPAPRAPHTTTRRCHDPHATPDRSARSGAARRCTRRSSTPPAAGPCCPSTPPPRAAAHASAPDCPKPGKHPRTQHGVADATHRPRPGSSVVGALAATPTSRSPPAACVVLDIDGPPADAALAALERATSRCPRRCAPTPPAASTSTTSPRGHAAARSAQLGRASTSAAAAATRSRRPAATPPATTTTGPNPARLAPLPAWLAAAAATASERRHAPQRRQRRVARRAGAALPARRARWRAGRRRARAAGARATRRSTAPRSGSANSPAPASATPTSSSTRCSPPRSPRPARTRSARHHRQRPQRRIQTTAPHPTARPVGPRPHRSARGGGARRLPHRGLAPQRRSSGHAISEIIASPERAPSMCSRSSIGRRQAPRPRSERCRGIACCPEALVDRRGRARPTRDRSAARFRR